MKKARMIGLAALLASTPAWAYNWEVIYSEDFSSDPGWQTNNPANYHWVAGAYYQREVDGSDEYTYKILPSLASGAPWRLEYDTMVESIELCGDARFGLFSPAMSITHTHMHMNFLDVSIGEVPTTDWRNDNGLGGYEHFYDRFYSVGIWYHTLLEWDPVASSLYAKVTVRDTGALLGEETSYPIGPFTGLDRIGATTIGDYSTPDRVAESLIDNVVVSTPEPATVLLLSLAGVLLCRRCRRA